MRKLFLIVLTFSVCFVLITSVLAHEFSEAVISARALAVGLVILGAITIAGTRIVFKGKSESNSTTLSVADGRSVSQNNGNRLAVWLFRGALIALILALLSGLLHIREKPLGPRLAGVGANLLVTSTLIVALRRIQQRPK